jgi:hypothetical protein
MPEAKIEKTEIVEIATAARQYDNAKIELAKCQEAIDIAKKQLAQKEDNFAAAKKRVDDAEASIRKLARSL